MRESDIFYLVQNLHNFMEESESKNEYLLKKEQKEKEVRSEQIKKKMRRVRRMIIYFAILFLVVSGVYKLITRKSVPPPGHFYEAQSREHIDIGATHPAYNSNPPSGGWHYAVPAQTGIYDKELSDEQAVHNLEHSHIWFAYKSDLAKGQIDALAEIAKDYGSRIIMTPRAANDSPIAIVAWQYVYKLNIVDVASEAQIRAFVDAYRNVAGPERNIPDSGFGDFRGQNKAPPVAPMRNN